MCGDKGPEQLLVDYILSNYSRLGRPVKDPQKAVNVSIELSVTELISMVRIQCHSKSFSNKDISSIHLLCAVCLEDKN